MKLQRTIFAAAIIFCAAQAFGQNFLRNPGFESWNGNLPVGWSTDTISSHISAISHSGNAALKFGHSSIFGITFLGSIVQDSIPVSGTSFSFKGWYQFYPQGGDRIEMLVMVTGPDNMIGGLVGAGSLELTDAKSIYTAFSVGVTMLQGASGDTASISIFSVGDSVNDDLHPGTYALFDDFVLDNSVTAVNENEFAHPTTFSLAQNYPNPFNPTTQIEFTVPKRSHVALKVFNMMGQEVRTLVDQELQAGRYRKVFDGAHLPSGVYIYRIQAGSFSQTNKMVLVK